MQNGNPKEGLLRGVIFDAGDLVIVDNVETYRFFAGGLSGKLQATLVITYTDSTREDIANYELTKT